MVVRDEGGVRLQKEDVADVERRRRRPRGLRGVIRRGGRVAAPAAASEARHGVASELKHRDWHRIVLVHPGGAVQGQRLAHHRTLPPHHRLHQSAVPPAGAEEADGVIDDSEATEVPKGGHAGSGAFHRQVVARSEDVASVHSHSPVVDAGRGVLRFCETAHVPRLAGKSAFHVPPRQRHHLHPRHSP